MKKYRVLITGLLLMFVCSAFGKTIPLDGEWQMRVDEKGEGVEQRYFGGWRPMSSLQTKKRRSSHESQNIEHDWKQVTNLTADRRRHLLRSSILKKRTPMLIHKLLTSRDLSLCGLVAACAGMAMADQSLPNGVTTQTFQDPPNAFRLVQYQLTLKTVTVGDVE